MSSPGATDTTNATPLNADVPPLPENATPEQKDEHWFKYVYQGDKMPQLTLRAVLMGGLLGMLMAAANLYTTLAIGWAFGIAITACVLSYVIWNVVRMTAPKHISQMSVLENACMASTASAAGYSTGSTIATMFGALVLLKDVPEGTPLSTIKTWDVTDPWILITFTLCTGLMGVFLAIPMKRQQINHEQLPFPSGIAAAETLKSLYSASREAMHKAYVLVVGLGAGLLIGFLRASEDVIQSVGFLKSLFSKINFARIPEEFKIRIIDRFYHSGQHAAGFSFEPSALLIAAGMIVGMRTSVSMLVGSLLLYGVVGPKLSELDGARLEQGSIAIVSSVEQATGIQVRGDAEAINAELNPEETAKKATDAVAATIGKLKIEEPERVLRAAQRGAAGALADIEVAKGEKSVEAMLRAAEQAGLNTHSVAKAVKRAVADSESGTDAVRNGAAIAEAVRQAAEQKVDSAPMLAALARDRKEIETATDKEAGEAILSAVLTAATTEGVDANAIRSASTAAIASAKANPGREGAAAARKEAVRLIFDVKENDPSALEKAVDQAETAANQAATEKVNATVKASIDREAGALKLDLAAIWTSANAAAAACDKGPVDLRVAVAAEAIDHLAKAKAIDPKLIHDASNSWQFTADEKREHLKGIVGAVVGGPGGAAGTAGANWANADAFKARKEAETKADEAKLTYRKKKEASEAAWDGARYKQNLIWNWGAGEITLTRWSLWGGTAVMVFSSLMSVALQWKTIARAFSGVRRGTADGGASELQSIEVPGKWMVMGMLPITIAMVWLQIVAFQVSWYAGVIAVAMSFVLSLVASRATGETDTTPIGAMGKVMQLMFAVLAPKNIAANLASAGIAANSASSSADLLTDLKTGYLLGANPRKQFLAQFFGVFFGTVAIVPIWYLMVPHRAKLETFAMPATRAWEAVARVLVKGVGELPASAIFAIFIGAAVGCALPLIDRLLPAKARKYMPSATGLGLAWVIPFQNAFSFFIGAVVALLWWRVHKSSQEKFNVPIASGLVAGESLMAAALAITATAVGLLG